MLQCSLTWDCLDLFLNLEYDLFGFDRGHVLKENQCVINAGFRGIIGSCALQQK